MRNITIQYDISTVVEISWYMPRCIIVCYTVQKWYTLFATNVNFTVHCMYCIALQYGTYCTVL